MDFVEALWIPVWQLARFQKLGMTDEARAVHAQLNEKLKKAFQNGLQLSADIEAILTTVPRLGLAWEFSSAYLRDQCKPTVARLAAAIPHVKKALEIVVDGQAGPPGREVALERQFQLLLAAERCFKAGNPNGYYFLTQALSEEEESHAA